MLSALLLFAAVTFGQWSVEKIPVRHVPPEDLIKAVDGRIAGIAWIIFDPTENAFIVQGNTESIKSLRKLVGEVDQQSGVRVVLLKNISVLHVYEALTGTGRTSQKGNDNSFLSEGMRVFANAHTNVIVAFGPSKELSEFENIIRQLDIKSKLLNVDLQASVPKLDMRFTVSGTVASDSDLEYSDGRIGCKLKISARLGADGSILLIVTGGVLGADSRAEVRVRTDERAFVIFAPTVTGLPGTGPSNIGDQEIVTSGVIVDPEGFLKGAPFAAERMEKKIVTPAFKTPKMAELRLVIKATLPAQ